METIRLILKKIFDIIGTAIKISIIILDLGGFASAALFAWVYNDGDNPEEATFIGFVIGTILWIILVVYVCGRWMIR